MPERETISKALEMALQAAAYDQVGPAGVDLATGARRELAVLTKEWSEEARASLAGATVALEGERHQLDRGRNHFIKDFRQRHGADARGYAPEIRAQMDAGMANFNHRKALLLEDASLRLLAEIQSAGSPA